jgi:hypothetical protein
MSQHSRSLQTTSACHPYFVFHIGYGIYVIGSINPGSERDRSSGLYNTAADTLKNVLISFSQRSGVMISYTESDIANKRSLGINGSFTVPEALNILPTGTGLETSKQVEGGFALRLQVPGITMRNPRTFLVSATIDF